MLVFKPWRDVETGLAYSKEPQMRITIPCIHTYIIGRAPDDVKDDKTLQFDLKWQAGKHMEHNDALIQARATRLSKYSKFRVEQPQNKFERSFHPRYSDDVHAIKQVKGPWVQDDQGKQFPTRHVQAVPTNAAPISTEGMGGGSDQTDRLRIQILEPYKARISNFLGDLGKFEYEVANYMKEIGMAQLMTSGLSYRKALTLLGFTVHGNARGSGKRLVTRPAQNVAPAVIMAAPRRRLIDPAAAAAALAAPPVRRRVVGKQPGDVRP